MPSRVAGRLCSSTTALRWAVASLNLLEQAMTQADLNRAVARATGESVTTIAGRGFVPLRYGVYERDLRTVDWDELDAGRPGLFPLRPRQRTPSR